MKFELISLPYAVISEESPHGFMKLISSSWINLLKFELVSA